MSVLDRFVTIRRYRSRAAEFRDLAGRSPVATIRNRYLAVAAHYEALAEAEALSDRMRSAERLKQLRSQREGEHWTAAPCAFR